MDEVAVIGCGPAGLLAAWAAKRAGYLVDIFSDKKAPSVQLGAQYIHSPIPDITVADEAQPIHYSHIGEASGYAKKIYGDELRPEETSWYKFEGTLDAWSMSDVYQRLWNFFSERIIEAKIDYGRMNQLARQFTAVFSSAPLPALIGNTTNFYSERVYVYPRMITPGYGIRPDRPNVIVYNGHESSGWYRQSRIFGKEFTEWPGRFGADRVAAEILNYGHEYNHLSLMQVSKPVSFNIPQGLVLPPNVRLVGRYGQWRKGVLAHEAYEDTLNYLESLSEVDADSTTLQPTRYSTGVSQD